MYEFVDLMMMASEAETEAVSESDDCVKAKAEYLATVQRLLSIHNLESPS